MVQTDANPGGLPKSVFDDLQAQLAANRSEFYRALPSGPFYGFNRPGAKPSEAIIENWWRQGMMGGAKAQYDGVVAFSQTDFTEDLKKITVPVLVMHGDDDQIVPYADSGPLSARLVQNGKLKTYKGFPHGNLVTSAEVTTIADGVAVRVPVAAALEWMSEFVDDMILIDDAQLREALRIARDTIGLILEPSGALGIAAALHHRIPGRKPATIVTGSNFSVDILAELSTEQLS